MPYFKSSDGRVHFLENADFAYLLPPNSVPISDADAESSQATLSVPTQVTMRQARLALLETGKLSAVNAAIAAMPGPSGDAARIEWEFSSTVERNRPFVASLAASLSMTEKQLDTLFVRAAEL